VEASVSGDFHDPASAPHTTVLAPLDEHHAVANLVSTTGGETIGVLDMEPGDAAPAVPAHGPVSPRARRKTATRPKSRPARRRSRS
jgi:hypothetical protein